MTAPLPCSAVPHAARGAEASRAAAIRVFVVDDYPVARGGLAVMLRNADGIEWVGEAGSAADALREAPAVDPDVVLIDDDLPGMDGVHAAQLLRQQLPRARFLMLMREPDAGLERRASEAGVIDVLPKSAGPEDLTGAIKSAYLGRTPLRVVQPPSASASRQQLGGDLTARERDLLTLLSHGLSNQEISAKLGIAVPTVKFHVSNVMSKLGVENRTSAVLVALRHRLVEPR